LTLLTLKKAIHHVNQNFSEVLFSSTVSLRS
jgi:hypothetical protein